MTTLSPFSERLSDPRRSSPSTGRWSSSAVLASEMLISDDRLCLPLAHFRLKEVQASQSSGRRPETSASLVAAAAAAADHLVRTKRRSSLGFASL